jgi:broad specificity phosphatase PhoE
MKRRRLPAVALAALLAAPAAAQQLEGEALVEALRAGGYVIFFRHAKTDWAQRDAEGMRLADCSTQRNLSESGRAQATGIGLRVAQLGIPVGPVLASPYCRCRETAERAFGRAEVRAELASLARASDEEKQRRIAALKRLLTAPPPAGTNAVIVGHGDQTEAALELKLDEGEAAIFRPGGAEPALVGKVKSQQWHALARAAAARR